jgi:hypothetical protein
MYFFKYVDSGASSIEVPTGIRGLVIHSNDSDKVQLTNVPAILGE